MEPMDQVLGAAASFFTRPYPHPRFGSCMLPVGLGRCMRPVVGPFARTKKLRDWPLRICSHQHQLQLYFKSHLRPTLTTKKVKGGGVMYMY